MPAEEGLGAVDAQIFLLATASSLFSRSNTRSSLWYLRCLDNWRTKREGDFAIMHTLERIEGHVNHRIMP